MTVAASFTSYTSDRTRPEPMSKAFTKEDDDQEEEGPETPIPTGERHITPEGYRRLAAERTLLWTTTRRQTVIKVADAAAEGDRSENAEYIYGKRKLREIDRRIRYLTRLLERLTIVEPRQQGERVYFGAWVTVADEDGQESEYRLVGPDETDAEAGHISVQAPMARALIGKQVGDVVTVRRPRGEAEYEIVALRYES